MRRHVQREHRHIAGRIPTKFGSTRVLPDPLVAAASVLHAQHQQRMAEASASVVSPSPAGSDAAKPSGVP